MYFYSRNNLINDFFSIVFCYIIYFLLVLARILVLARKSQFTIFFIRSLRHLKKEVGNLK